ncbi:MAG: extracellular solute-binding protein [Spirochaetales bacterium]|nr:extracellular solute-binding protein [Spirochaetales bacterium]
MKKLLAVLFLILPLLSAFAAGQQDEAAASDGPVSVDFYTWSDGDDQYSDLFDAFNAANTDVQINPQYIPPADYESKLTTLLAGGMEMDGYMQKRQVDMFAQNANGYIEPLNDLIERNGFDYSTMKAWSAAIEVDGDILALPHRGGKYYTYYNIKPFVEKGLPTPTELVKKGEWTWDKFIELSQQVSENDGKTFGSCIYTWGSQQIFPAAQQGVQFVDSNGMVDVRDSILQSAQMRKTLEDSMAMPKLVDLKVTKTHYSQVFYSGMAPMLVIGEWFPGMITSGAEKGLLEGYGPEDFRITRMPSDTPEYYSVGAPTFGHVHSRSKNKDAAFQVLAWFAGVEGAKVEAEMGLLPPVVNDDVLAVLSKGILDKESLDYFTEDVSVRPMFYTKYGSKVEQLVARYTEMYLLGEISDADYLPSMKKELQNIADTTD